LTELLFVDLSAVHGITSTPRSEVENPLNFSGTRHCVAYVLQKKLSFLLQYHKQSCR